MRVLIVGAGGHGQVVADILLARCEAGDRSLTPVGFVDDDPALTGQTLLSLPVLGPISACAAIPHEALVLGIGANATRARLAEQLQASGEQLLSAVHPSAILGTQVRIGPGSVICAGVVINTGAVIGRNVILNTGCTIDHHNRIGDHAHIAPGANLGGDVTVGPGTLVGIGATVLPQQQIGAWSVIGGGAVVTHPLPDAVTAVGVPARIIRTNQNRVNLTDPN